MADTILSGEIEQQLIEVIQSRQFNHPQQPALTRWDYPLPARDLLPKLDAYARLEINGETRLAGYTETTRGCLHTCTHCPIVPIYNGRFFAVPCTTVLADIRQQVQAGARHITFGDPDFLNGPTHALKIARALHEEFPNITFDFTAKVDHLIQCQAILPAI